MFASFLYTPEESGRYCHCPSLLQTHSGSLMAAWYGYPEEEHKKAGLILSHCKDNLWQNSITILEPSNFSLGNPVLFCDPLGIIWLLFVRIEGSYWNDARLYGCYSSNNGITWSSPQRLWEHQGLMIRHPPIALSDQRLLLPAYDEIHSNSVLLISNPPYQKWSEHYRFEGVNIIQPVITQTVSNRLLIFFRPTQSPQFIWRSHSADGGKSWAAPVRTSLPNPLSGIAAFGFAENTVIIYNHTYKHQRFPLNLAISKDCGLTWSEAKHVDSSSHEVSYPSFIYEENKGAHGVYTYNRRMIKYVFIAESELLCRDSDENQNDC